MTMFFQPPALLQQPVVQTYLVVLWAGTFGGIIGLGVLLHPAVPRSPWYGKLVALPKVGPMIGSLVNAVLLYQSRGRVLVFCVLMSVVGHIGMLSGFYFCALAVKAGPAAPGFWEHLLLIPGAELAAVFIPVPGAIGTMEGLVPAARARPSSGRNARAGGDGGGGRSGDGAGLSDRHPGDRAGRCRLLLLVAERDQSSTQKRGKQKRGAGPKSAERPLPRGTALSGFAALGRDVRDHHLRFGRLCSQHQRSAGLLAGAGHAAAADVVAQGHDRPRDRQGSRTSTSAI